MSLFELFSVLIVVVALCGYLNYKLVRLPDTIGITAVALILSLIMAALGAGAPQIAQWGQQAIRGLDFPALVFHGMLGPLLFAGSLHVDVSALAQARWTILLLATLGVVISTLLVGVAFFYCAGFFGLQIPLIYCLLFGALISPTDPIAALGLLRKAGVPERLQIKITGESLFNDGTGVVAFILLLGIATGTSPPGFGSALGMLAWEVLGAVGFGLAFGYAGFVLLRGVDSYAVETLITLAMPTAGYAIAEAMQVSAPIAVVIMGLVVGNHGKQYAMSERTRERLFSFWELADDLLNLLLFGLIGLELMALAATAQRYLGPALLAIPLVLGARFVSVGLPILALRRFQAFEPHTIKMMTWAGLRGAISVALALSLPQGESREAIVTATYVVAVFSILVQATTIQPLARRWARKPVATTGAARG
jgi:Na+:H+ antiporter